MKSAFQKFHAKPNSRPERTQPGSFSAGRSNLVLGIMTIVFLTLCVRAVVVHLFASSSSSLTDIADRQYQLHLDLAPYRGTIYDRKGEPLAISIRRPSLAINPRVFNPNHDEVEEISRALQKNPRDIQLISDRKTYFAWLDRQVHHRAADRIAELNLKGLHEVTEPARFYPVGKAAAHLLGYVGIDSRGLLGVELSYEKDLRGQSQKLQTSRDGKGHKIFTDTVGTSPDKPGNSLYLTIDRAIQEIAEEALLQGAQAARAKSGFAIVSDPHTGRVLAVANYPQFDPNEGRNLRLDRTKNNGFVDTFEPGSTMKTFVVAAALESKKTYPDDVHFCENGSYKAGGRTFRDDHPAGFLTTTGTLVKSSNICTYKIATRLGKDGLYEALTRFGFGGGQQLLSSIPGAISGRMAHHSRWPQIQFANIAFGQGLVVSGLEMIQAYSAIANGGNLMRPMVVDRIESSDGVVLSTYSPETVRRTLTPETAQRMRKMLAEVVVNKEGTGHKAATPRYSVAGKTGTSQKVDPITRRYSPDKRLASFIGFAPVNDPYLVVYVVIDEPDARPAYGGLWAAPVFSKIVDQSLRYLNVAPDIQPEPPKGTSQKAPVALTPKAPSIDAVRF